MSISLCGRAILLFMYSLRTFSLEDRGISIHTSVSLNRERILSVEFHLANNKMDFSWFDFFRIEEGNLLETELGLEHQVDQLWKSHCFELFFSNDSQHNHYYELNYSLKGLWALYEFSSYRTGMKKVSEPSRLKAKTIYNCTSRIFSIWLSFDASSLLPKEKIFVAPTVVLVGEDEVQFWALNHSSDKPDFHNFKESLIEVKIED